MQNHFFIIYIVIEAIRLLKSAVVELIEKYIRQYWNLSHPVAMLVIPTLRSKKLSRETILANVSPIN